MDNPFVSKLANCSIHPAGWVELASGALITRLPLWDTSADLFARLGWGQAPTGFGLRLPTVAEYRELFAMALHIAPFTLPTSEMLEGAGVPRPWIDEDGQDSPAMARYRAENIRSRSWCKAHDLEVFARLDQANFDMEPVFNAGKHWATGGRIFGWASPGGSMIQPARGAHGSTYTDYATTTHLVFEASAVAGDGRPVEISPPAVRPTLRRGSTGPDVRDWQLFVAREGFELGEADGKFGRLTKRATFRWQEVNGLTADGIVGPKTWAAAASDVPSDTQPAIVEIVTGVDISSWQRPKDLDWPKLAESHTFAVGRACYGRAPDKTFRTHIAAARGAGLLVGGYCFYRQQQTALEQFEAFHAALESANIGPGDILPVIDLEENERYDGELSKAIHNTEGRKLVEAVAELYGGVICYLSPAYFVNIGSPAWLKRYPWWIAHYTSKPEPTSQKPWDVWQWTGKGKTPGYRGAEIDLNRAKRLRLIE